jgi:hypothetical protein
MTYLTTLKEHLVLFWRLRNGTKIRYAKIVRRYLEPFLECVAMKIPQKIKSVEFISELDCVTIIKLPQLRITFSLRKKNRPIKPEIYCITFDCCHFNKSKPGLNPKVICATRSRPDILHLSILMYYYYLGMTRRAVWCVQIETNSNTVNPIVHTEYKIWPTFK